MCCELQNSNNKIVGFTVADYPSIKFPQKRSIKKDISGETTMDYMLPCNKMYNICDCPMPKYIHCAAVNEVKIGR